MRCKKINKILAYGFGIFSQITIIFTFLVIFYFNYVELVEKKTFLHQIDQVLDELVKPIRSKFIKLHPYKSDIDAGINYLIKDIKSDNSQSNKATDKTNRHLAHMSMNMVYGCIGVFLLYTLIVTLTKNCLPLKSIFRESVIALLFIALTEYLFLQIVVANYKSADPNYVKRTIAQAIQAFAEKQKA